MLNQMSARDSRGRSVPHIFPQTWLKYDEDISCRIFKWELGAGWDRILAPHGMVFGMPTSLFGMVVPLLVAAVMRHDTGLVNWLYGCIAGCLYSIAAIADDVRCGSFSASPMSDEKVYIAVIGLIGIYGNLVFETNGNGALFALCSTLMLTQQVNQIIKKLAQRPRPARELLKGHRGAAVRAWSVNEGACVAGMPEDAESFPSGDAAQSGALCVAAFLMGAPALWVLPHIVGSVWGRVYFGCHWAADSIAGFLQGCIGVWCINSVLPFAQWNNADVWNWKIMTFFVLFYVGGEAMRKKVFSK
eukprot:m.191469 g.191469  ORF g.191469 m.191469 type:complete len:302 (-) comp18593_c0_seq7:423-1328(-)